MKSVIEVLLFTSSVIITELSKCKLYMIYPLYPQMLKSNRVYSLVIFGIIGGGGHVP